MSLCDVEVGRPHYAFHFLLLVEVLLEDSNLPLAPPFRKAALQLQRKRGYGFDEAMTSKDYGGGGRRIAFGAAGDSQVAVATSSIATARTTRPTFQTVLDQFLKHPIGESMSDLPCGKFCALHRAAQRRDLHAGGC